MDFPLFDRENGGGKGGGREGEGGRVPWRSGERIKCFVLLFFFFSKAGIVSTRSVSMLNELHLARDYAGGNFREEFESG